MAVEVDTAVRLETDAFALELRALLRPARSSAPGMVHDPVARQSPAGRNTGDGPADHARTARVAGQKRDLPIGGDAAARNGGDQLADERFVSGGFTCHMFLLFRQVEPDLPNCGRNARPPSVSPCRQARKTLLIG